MTFINATILHNILRNVSLHLPEYYKLNFGMWLENILTCESSLFFQTAEHYSPCRKSLLLHYRTPILQRHETSWICHFPNWRQVTILCPQDTNRTGTELLFRANIIYNATECSISSSEISTMPELHGTTRTRLDTPSFYLPDQPSVLEIHELPQIEAAPTEVMKLNNITLCLVSPQRSLEVDMLFHICQTLVHRQNQP